MSVVAGAVVCTTAIRSISRSNSANLGNGSEVVFGVGRAILNELTLETVDSDDGDATTGLLKSPEPG